MGALAGMVLASRLSLVVTTPSPSPDPLSERVRVLSEGLVAPDAATRESARRELLAMGSPAIEPLLLLVSRNDTPQAFEVRELLPRFGPEHIKDFARARAESAAIEAVARMGKAVLPEITTLLDFQPEGLWLPPFRNFAIGVLFRMGPEATDTLIGLLKHPKKEVRSNAATVLSNVADPRAADALLEALNSPEGNVKGNAALGLGKMHEKRAIEPLLRMLKEDPAWPARGDAAAGLGMLYERRLRVPLAIAARGDHLSVRDTAAVWLVQQRQDRVAIRLGRHYKPMDHGPQWLIQGRNRMWHVFRLVATAILLYSTVLLAVNREGPAVWKGVSKAVWWSGGAMAAAGFYWGCFMTVMSANLEYALLLLCIPGTLWLGWVVGPTFGPVRYVAIGLGVTLAVLTGFLFLGMLLADAAWGVVPFMLIGYLGLVVLLAPLGGWTGDPEWLARFRRALVQGAAGFYAGYGVGTLALWGWFGF